MKAICTATDATVARTEKQGPSAAPPRTLLTAFRRRYAAIHAIDPPAPFAMLQQQALADEAKEIGAVQTQLLRVEAGEPAIKAYEVLSRTMAPIGAAENAIWRKIGCRPARPASPMTFR